MPSRVAFAAIVACLLFACSSPDAPVTAPTAGPSLAISDGAHQGNTHFYFLPPMVSNPSFSGTADPQANPVVMVCTWTEVQGRCDDVVTLFGMDGGTDGERITFDAASGKYQVNWHTDRCLTGACTLSTTRLYRLRVLVGSAQLGFADVIVVSNGSALKNLKTNETIGLVNGRTLPVKFRIEHGAVGIVGAGQPAQVGPAGGLVTTADGEVALLFPAGALGAATSISVTDAPAAPEGIGPWSPVVDLGPDGAAFAAPVTLGLQYRPELLPAGVPASALMMVTSDGSGWVEVPGGNIDSVDNIVSAPIHHFSTYGLLIRPNYTSGVLTTPPLSVGQTARLEAVGYGYYTGTSTYCYWVRTGWFSRRRECFTYTTAYDYRPHRLAVSWSSNAPAVAAIAPGPTYTDASGVAISPPILAVAPGTADIRATGGGLVTPPWPITVLPAITLTVIGDRNDGQPRNHEYRDLGIGQAFSLVASIPSPATSDLVVTFRHTNPGIVTSNPTGTINAGQSSRGVGQVGAATGRDTVIVSAPGYSPDSVVIDVSPGRTIVADWPATLLIGDSARIRIHPLNPTGTIIDNGYSTTWNLEATPNLRFSNGTTQITSIPVIDGSNRSEYFYVTAVGTGTGTLNVTHPNYITTTKAVAISGTPVINPIPQGATQLLIQVLPGSQAAAVAQILNAGDGQLAGLQAVGPFRNCYTGQIYDWLSFNFASTTAPTGLTVTATVPAGTPYGVYDICYSLRGTGAADRGWGTRVSVQEVVLANGPFINPFPQGRSQGTISVRAGESGFRDVPVSNAGGGTLSGLTLVGPVRNCFNGQEVTWLTHQWIGGTTAPTTLRLIATPPAAVGAGEQQLCFELQARAAGAMDYAYGVKVDVLPAYTLAMADLGTLGGTGTSVASGLNNAGQVVGYSNGAAAYWSSLTAAPSLIPNPYGDLNYAFDINNMGQVIGRTPYVGWLHTPATGTTVAGPGAFPVSNRVWAMALNNTGVALVCTDNGSFAQNHTWNLSTNATALIAEGYNWCDGAINDAGKAVVTRDNSGQSWYYDPGPGTVTPIPGFGGRSAARDINNGNIVVGSSINAMGQVRAYRWDAATGALLDLGTLGGTEAEALGINDQGWIVGWSRTATGDRHAFVRNPVSGWMYDLGALSGNDQSGAMDISETLDIVGWSSVGNPTGLGGMIRTIGVIGGTTRATRWSVR